MIFDQRCFCVYQCKRKQVINLYMTMSISTFQVNQQTLNIMINSSNNIVKKAQTCASIRNFDISPVRSTGHIMYRKRSRSVSSISSKQSSLQNNLQKKINYKLSRQHVILLIQEQRMRDQEVIEQNQSLSDYYNCFKNLFKIIYLSACSVIKHSFYNGDEQLSLNKMQIIGSLIGDYEVEWSLSKSSKLMILSQNIYQLSKSIVDFERRIEYVARKVCMNKAKRVQIQDAFVNQVLMKNWEAMLNNQQFVKKNQFILDMFEKDSQKLCYFDVRKFVNKCLCKAEFRETIVRWTKKQEIDEQMDVSFTFEFFLIEQFCLGEDLEINEIKSKLPVLQKQQAKCHIM